MSITLPLSIFLLIYALLLAGLVFFALLNIVHLVRTGSLTMASFIATLAVMILLAFTLYGTWFLLQDTNWTQPLNIFNSDWLGGLFRLPTTFE